MADTDRSFEVLDPAACYELLGRVKIARLGVAQPGLAPLIVPINVALDGDAIVFRSDWGEKIELLRQYPVSVQADEFDFAHRTGWSVLAQGHAGEVTGGLDDPPAIDTWAPGQRPRWIRLRPTSITGRRIELHLEPPDGRGYL